MPDNSYDLILERKEPYVIAEIGANHNGEMDLAKKLVDEAKRCGCDAVKFQSWSKRSLFTNGFYKDQSQFVDDRFGTLEEMVERFSLNEQKHLELKTYCEQKQIGFCSSAFSFTEVDMLLKLNVPYFKIASMDLNNPGFLKYVAEKGKPILLSTGMGNLGEIETALNTIYKAGNKEVILLHCVSIYPPDDGTVNLRNIDMLRKTFAVPIGFSDHTIGTTIPLAAIALGAKVIEKHFTLDKNLPGWDHCVSANPEEMEVLVREGRRVATALGLYQRIVSEVELEQTKAFRRSIVAKRDLKQRAVFSENDADFKRPGSGISPDELKYIVGRKVKRDIQQDELINWEDLE